jgi:flagellar biosynthesis protein FliQ
MTAPPDLLELWRAALVTTASVAAPFVLATLAVGLVVAVVQTATQLQESVLVFAPKLLAALLVAGLAGHWMLDRLEAFSLRAFGYAAEEQRW